LRSLWLNLNLLRLSLSSSDVSVSSLLLRFETTLASSSTSNVWIESSVSDEDSGLSHSESLEDEEYESKQVTPKVAVTAVHNHGNDRDQSEDVNYKRIYKVSDEKSWILLAGSSNAKRHKDDGNKHVQKASHKQDQHCRDQLNETQEVNPSCSFSH